jgi:hypothetical protein
MKMKRELVSLFPEKTKVPCFPIATLEVEEVVYVVPTQHS